MFATVHRVSNLEQKFADLSHVAGNGKAFKLTNIDRAPGSGQSADLISHHQGMCKLMETANLLFPAVCLTKAAPVPIAPISMS